MSRGRLVMQAVTESLVLASLGADIQDRLKMLADFFRLGGDTTHLFNRIIHDEVDRALAGDALVQICRSRAFSDSPSMNL